MNGKRICALLLALCLLAPTALAAGQGTGFANFRRSRVYDGRFQDVPEGTWYFASVRDAYELELLNGIGADAFSPDGPLTVSEALALACRLLDTWSRDGHVFPADDPWYRPYVDYAVAEGLIRKDQFEDYEAPATRAQVAAILGVLPKGMLASINTVQDNAIPDVSPGSTYYAPVYALYRAGILVGGDEAGSFRPDTDISRCETAALAVRLAVPSARMSVTLTAKPVTLYADNGDRIAVSPGEAPAYEAQGWQRAPFTVPSDRGTAAALNAATLRQMSTGDEDLDALVDGIFRKIFTPEMTTYDKVRACYDYLIGNTAPGGGSLRVPGFGPYESFSDYVLVLEAQRALADGQGVYDDYAAALLVMLRCIGLSCYAVSGETGKSGGGWTAHAWDVVTIGGTDFIFDAYAEDGLAAGGKIQYQRFCKTLDQAGRYYRGYDLAAAKESFGGFQR